MRQLLVAICAVGIAPLLGSASPLQDEAAAMKWTLVDGDKFELKWSFSETRRREPGRGEVNESHDKRDVDAELAFKADGILTLTLKKVAWSYGNQDSEVTLMYVEGKKLDPQLKMKAGPTAPGYQVSKADADRMVDYMKKLTEGEFTINTSAEVGRTLVMWNGGNVRNGTLSLFDRIFTHPLLPSGPVRVGQLFKDPLEVTNLPAGLVEVKTVESKVTAVGDKGSIAKGGLNVPVAKSIIANNQTQNWTGNFIYSCEWNYHPQQYLQGSKEESKFTKKVDAKGKDADFYRENFTHTITQALTIKKKAPKPGEEKKPATAKPDEPKPDEKKPEEKKEEK
jgi:hypothetical protein